MLERPTQAELQSAMRKLEQLGDYQTYFGENPEAIVNAQVPHYQEYNYLHFLVTDAQALVDHYDDATWLQEHKITDATFQDILEAMQHAYRGCSLIFEVNRTTATTTTTAKPSATSTTTPQATTPTPTTSTTTTSKAVKGEVFTPATVPAPTVATTATTTTTTPAPTLATDDTTNEIAVPATGIVAETSTRQISLPALIAVVVAGAVIASIAIAIIIRHEPRRATHSRSRRHY